jgi:hypothetical protein
LITLVCTGSIFNGTFASLAQMFLAPLEAVSSECQLAGDCQPFLSHVVHKLLVMLPANLM